VSQCTAESDDRAVMSNTQGAYGQTRKWTSTLAVDYMAHGGSVYTAAGSFSANSDQDTVVSNSLASPFIARYIRCVWLSPCGLIYEGCITYPLTPVLPSRMPHACWYAG